MLYSMYTFSFKKVQVILPTTTKNFNCVAYEQHKLIYQKLDEIINFNERPS